MGVDRFVVRDWPAGPHGRLRCRARETWPAVIELDGAPRDLTLRISDEPGGYTVSAEFEDALADGFEVAVTGCRVVIAVRDACGRQASDAWTRISLAFDAPIDAAASRGACADHLLHLTLRTGTAQASSRPAAAIGARPTPLALACAP